MADTHLARLIGERRKRLVATIMGHAEREFFDRLTSQQQREFRAKTLQAIDEFADLMRDILKISGEDVVLNQYAIDLLSSLHEAQRDIAEKLSV